MKRLLISLGLSFLAFNAFAQEETEEPKGKFEFGGSIDAYFRSNLTAPNDENAIAPNTSFANLPGFALGMVNLIGSFESADGKVGAVADLVFGPRGTDAVFASPMYSATGNIVNQLYAYYNVNDKLTLTLGNFNTFLGYEVISPVANFNYSTSYMFSYGPFSHTGLKANYAVSEDFSLMLALMNSTDLTEFNPDGSYTGGLQLGYKGQYLNFLYGDQTNIDGTNPTIFQVDYTGGFDLTEEFYLGLNATYFTTDSNIDGADSSSFYGVALYPQYTVSEKFKVGLRGEYFGVTNSAIEPFTLDAEGDGSIIAATLTGSYEVGNLMIKPELRFDSASEDTFIDNDGAPAGSLASFLVAAIYKF